MKQKIFFLISIITILVFTGCSKKEVEVEKPKGGIIHTYTMEDTIIGLANGLGENINKKINTGDVVMTSFVELNNFKKTSKFGRLLSESLFHELFTRNIKMLDFRIKRALTINADGEFYLSRDVNSLNKSVHSKYILVGTYTKSIGKNLLINARIINTMNGKVISAAEVLYHDYDCRLFGDCEKPNRAIKITSTTVLK